MTGDNAKYALIFLLSKYLQTFLFCLLFYCLITAVSSTIIIDYLSIIYCSLLFYHNTKLKILM